MNNKLSVCQKNIGIWISDKKSQKLNWMELIKTCNLHGYNLIKVINLICHYCCIYIKKVWLHYYCWSFFQLDLEKPLEEQKECQVFLHKLTDIIAAADQGDPKVCIVVLLFWFEFCICWILILIMHYSYLFFRLLAL